MLDAWGVVEILIALVGFLFLIAKPLIASVKAMTKLTDTMEELSQDIKKMEKKSSEAHRKIWNHIGEHDETLKDHEIRIRIVEENIDNENGK